MIRLVWTTLHPYNPVADWEEWLFQFAGIQDTDWGWLMSDVISGDTDERSTFVLWFSNPAVETQFRLSFDLEIVP